MCLVRLWAVGQPIDDSSFLPGSVKMTLSGDETNAKRVVFNSADQLFSEIRDLNFASVGSVLSKRTKELSNIMQVSCIRASAPARTVLISVFHFTQETKSSTELTKLRQVVGQLPELRQLHSSASLRRFFFFFIFQPRRCAPIRHFMFIGHLGKSKLPLVLFGL